jgi:hypothetical protein
MATRKRRVRASDLPTKIVRAPDGSRLHMKVVQADSASLAHDLLAAFQSNVRRIKAEQRRRNIGAADSAQA